MRHKISHTAERVSTPEKISKKIRRLTLSATNTLRSVFLSLFGLVVNYLLIRYPTQDALSAYVYCMTAISLAGVFNNWGGKDYVTKTLSEQPSETTNLVAQLLFSRVLLFVCLVPAIILFGNINLMVVLLILLLLKSLTSVFESLVIVRKKFVLFFIAETSINLMFVMALLFSQMFQQARAFMALLVFVELLRLLVSFSVFRKEIRLKPSFTKTMQMIKTSTPFFLVSLAGFCCSRADLYVLGMTLDKALLNRYYVFLNLVVLCQVFYTTFISTFSAGIYRYSDTAFKHFEHFTFKTGLVLALAGTAAIFGLALLYFGLTLSPYLVLLLLVNLFAFSSTFSSVFYFNRGNYQSTVLKVIVSGAALNIALSFLLVKPFGINGAFTCNTLCGVFTAVAFKVHAQRIQKNKSNKALNS